MAATEETTRTTRRSILTYSVTAVEEIAAPEGFEGAWHRYVIEGGGSPITGCRQGSRQQVLDYAKTFVDDLNSRVKGKGASVWAPRLKKAPGNASG